LTVEWHRRKVRAFLWHELNVEVCEATGMMFKLFPRLPAL
jgi:hypothetical protein